MVRYSLDDISDEMVLGESIFLPSGEMLLAAGYKLKERYRERLKQLGYNSVLIEMEGTEGVEPTTTVSSDTQREMNLAVDSSAKDMENAFIQFRHKSTGRVKEIIKENRQYLSKYIMSSGMAKALEQFVNEIMTQSSIVLNLSALQQTQAGLLNHAMNVTITALCIGKKYKFSYDEMKQLGIGALNYDLGLIALSRELLEKRVDQMDEAELKLFHQHTLFGFYMLSQNPMIPSTSAAVALQHHEREDGSGYPRGLKGDNRPPLKDFSRQNVIHRFAEIVAVADSYDMLISGRQHHHKDAERTEVRQAVRKVIELAGTQLNSDVVKTLTTIVPLFPVGARVKIVNAPTPQLVGYYGVIARDNSEDLENPQIILYETKNHQKVKPIFVDLSKYKGFTLELVT